MLPENCKVIFITRGNIDISMTTIKLEGLTREEAIELLKEETNDSKHFKELSNDELTTLFKYSKGKPVELRLLAAR